MPLSEFTLIDRFFAGHKNLNSQVKLGVGDDCALLEVPVGYELAVTMDTMVEGVHFFSDVAPEDLAYKLLAVNLSDLASMGAQPIAVSLALTMPEIEGVWLQQFAIAFIKFSKQFGVDLIGGDTTKGTLTLSLQAMGLVPVGRALKRSAAQVGDLIFVTHKIGDAGLGLKILKEEYDAGIEAEQVKSRLIRPTPRVNEGIQLRNYANSCIDVSDGLFADLTHILEASRVGASIDWEKIPLSDAVKKYIAETGDWQMPLNAGDDYELCFTVSSQKLSSLNIQCSCIGKVESNLGLRINKAGVTQEISRYGFEHFS